MDVLLLGAAAIILLALTIWIVWRPGSSDTAAGSQEAASTMPQSDQFEDQYTSATADLSAGGVALSEAARSAEDAPGAANPDIPSGGAPQPGASVAQTVTTPPWPADTIHTEGSASGLEPIRRTAADDAARRPVTPTRVGLGAGALLTLGGAIGGAWLYARRIQRERNKPLNRLRRRFR